jgi:anti-sigma B factor antagonist
MHSAATRGSPESLVSRRSPGGTVLELHGDLDFATTEYLRERLLAGLRYAVTPVVLDLSGVTFCDANGLAMLVHIGRRARLLGLTFSLAALPDEMNKSMRITGLWRYFALRPTSAVPGDSAVHATNPEAKRGIWLPR